MNINNLSKDTLRKLKNNIISGKSSLAGALILTMLLNGGATYAVDAKDVTTDMILDKTNSLYQELDRGVFLELNKPISEMQEEFLAKYGVDYLNMVMAVTEIIPGVNLDYSGAYQIMARPDFEEMKKDFKVITDKKILYICKRYSINLEQLLMICRRMCNESGGLSYIETYHCCTCLYNRIFSYPWILDLNMHGYNGYNLFDQFRYPNQFGYGVPTKAQYDDPSKWIGYYAVLDMLSSECATHDYTGFRMASTGMGEQLEVGGNRYVSKVSERMDNPTLKEVIYEPKVTLEQLNGRYFKAWDLDNGLNLVRKNNSLERNA